MEQEEQFIECCETGDFVTAKQLYLAQNIRIHEDNDRAFRLSCLNGHLEIAKWLYSLGSIDIHVNNDSLFRWCCGKGQLEIVKWLYSLGGIDINSYDSYSGTQSDGQECDVDTNFAFVNACVNGHLEVAKWLYTLEGIDIYVDCCTALRGSCLSRKLEIVKWLLTLNNQYDAWIIYCCLPECLYEYYFDLGNQPINEVMEKDYIKWKAKLLRKIETIHLGQDGPVTIFEINGLPELITSYV
jgi:hypothetical protein